MKFNITRKPTMALFTILASLTTAAVADSSWTGPKIGIGLGGNSMQADSTTAATHDYTSSSSAVPGGLSGLGNTLSHTYTSTESFSGTAGGKSNLGQNKLFGTLDAAWDYQVNDLFVVGLIGNYDYGQKSRVNGAAAGQAGASWSEIYSYTYNGNDSGTGGENCTFPTQQNGCVRGNTSNLGVNNNSSNVGISNYVETGNSGAAGMRLGFLASKNTLLYATGGWTTIKVNQSATYSSQVNTAGANSTYGTSGSSNNYNLSDTVNQNSTTQDGYFLGAGLETRFASDKVSLKLEYRYSDYGTLGSNKSNTANLGTAPPNVLEFGPLGGSSNVSQHTDLTQQAIRAVLSYNF
jgi:hypothetical protein